MSQINDAWYEFLGSLGYEGHLNDRMLAYLTNQTNPPAWLLSGGTWSDAGAWDDTQVWEDS